MIKAIKILTIIGMLCLVSASTGGVILRKEEPKPLSPGDTSGGGTNLGWTLQWTIDGHDGLIVTDAHYKGTAVVDQLVAQRICLPWIKVSRTGYSERFYELKPEYIRQGGGMVGDWVVFNSWSIWAYYTLQASELGNIWLYIELNWIFYSDGLFRTVVTFHAEGETGITTWTIPIYVDIDALTWDNNIIELIDTNNDGYPNEVWTEEYTGMNGFHETIAGGPPADMNGKFWVRSSTSTEPSVVIEPVYPYIGHFIWVDRRYSYNDDTFYPEDYINGDWLCVGDNDPLFYYRGWRLLGQPESGSVSAHFYCYNY